MIIVRMWAGFGNQLFQYALYKKFKSLGLECYVDSTYYERDKEARPYTLPLVVGDLLEAEYSNVKKLAGNFDLPWTITYLKHFPKKTYFRERDLCTNTDILNITNGYFDGYWQSALYFDDIGDDIRSSIIFPQITDSQNVNYLNQIRTFENSVSLHVRLGDYLKFSDAFGGVCTYEYYKNAISYINENVSNPHYFIFSNDIEGAKAVLKGLIYDENVTFVEGNSEDYGYIDMTLMANCKHHIIANSSFSWWGAYLGEKNSGEINIAPCGWMKGIDSSSIVPDRWKRI